MYKLILLYMCTFVDAIIVCVCVCVCMYIYIYIYIYTQFIYIYVLGQLMLLEANDLH